MRKFLLVGMFFVSFFVIGCDEQNGEDFDNVDMTNLVNDITIHQEDQQTYLAGQGDEKGGIIDSSLVVADYENGYTFLQPGEIYRNDTYGVQFVNKGSLGAFVRVVDGIGQRYLELYKVCPVELAGYDLDLQYFVNNSRYKEQFSLEGDYRIRLVKTYISDPYIASMKECLLGYKRDCVSFNVEVPYLISEDERKICQGTVSSDPLCEKYNMLLEQYGTI